MKAISELRSELMGLAIMWIMLYHMGFKLPLFLAPVTAVKMLGLTGVDIFFLLSGLGISFSWHADPNTARFLQKRLVRIAPVFWTLVLFSLIRDSMLTSLALQDMTRFIGLDFLLLGQLDRWFVPAILLCYGLFVIVQKARTCSSLKQVLLLCLAGVLMLDLLLPDSELDHLLILTVRLPVFLLGILIGQHLIEGRAAMLWQSWKLNGALLLGGLALWATVALVVPNPVAWRYGLWWYPTALMAYPVCLFAAQWLTTMRTEGALRTCLRVFGQYSLELYLVHEFIYSLAPHLGINSVAINVWRLPEYLIYFLLSAVLAVWMGPRFARLKLSSKAESALTRS
ncbi:MAG: acyltransferase [Aquabacterium sp.]|uniref:acyltransferase family protein n=1 Tax=Aquabacterium sp. TaxID=1872578 RepID=UPI0025BA467D|nr:acyltransferase [Aquabacterium sp.]MBI5924578.1 acyltransferase [Aquabacterium sp.]